MHISTFMAWLHGILHLPFEPTGHNFLFLFLFLFFCVSLQITIKCEHVHYFIQILQVAQTSAPWTTAMFGICLIPKKNLSPPMSFSISIFLSQNSAQFYIYILHFNWHSETCTTVIGQSIYSSTVLGPSRVWKHKLSVMWGQYNIWTLSCISSATYTIILTLLRVQPNSTTTPTYKLLRHPKARNGRHKTNLTTKPENLKTSVLKFLWGHWLWWVMGSEVMSYNEKRWIIHVNVGIKNIKILPQDVEMRAWVNFFFSCFIFHINSCFRCHLMIMMHYYLTLTWKQEAGGFQESKRR